jgi:hypothetical protein
MWEQAGTSTVPLLSNGGTDCCGRVVNAPTLYSEGPALDSRPRQRAILIEGFRGFPQSLQANSGIIP